MNKKPAQEVLCDLIAKHGKSLAEDKIRCSALLRDYCSAYKAEINILITAMDEHVPSLLIKQPTSSPTDVVISQLAKRLRIDRGLAEENARWAVESWALALGVIQSSSISSSVTKPSPPKPPIPVPEPPTHPPSTWKPMHFLILGIALIIGAIILKYKPSSPNVSAPAMPAASVTPAMPAASVTPAMPAAPVTPAMPAAPVTPAMPAAPVTPATPAAPVTPATPAAPVTPATPAAPVTPATPAAPVTPATTAPPVTSGTAPKPADTVALDQVVRDYYAALNHRDVHTAVALWKNPPKGLISLVKNGDSYAVNEVKIVSAESYRAIVWVDVTGKSLDKVSSERWQGNIELEPDSSGKWAISSMKLGRVESERPKPTSTPTVVQDELVALVRQYYAALDRRDDKSAVALWKNPPKGLTALVKNVDYFKVNEASFRSAELDHASVWVDVIGKSLGEKKPEHWQGLVELEKDAGKWGIVALRVGNTK